MSNVLKTLCKSLPKSKIRALCDGMEACAWERELLLDWLCEPREVTIESFKHSRQDNYRQRLGALETRVTCYFADNPTFLDIKVLNIILIEMLRNQK